jgi:hypothetical protein
MSGNRRELLGKKQNRDSLLIVNRLGRIEELCHFSIPEGPVPLLTVKKLGVLCLYLS